MQQNKMTKEILFQLQSLPLDLKIIKSRQRIKEWVDYFGKDGVYVSFSGGKDSTVLLDLVRDMYPDTEALFSDTGLEFPEIKEFVKTKENVRWIKPETSFRTVIEKCGYPIISKEQSEWLSRLKATMAVKDFDKNILGRMSDGRKTKFHISSQWLYMADAPFKIGAGCCMEMKKKPIAKYCRETGKVGFVGTMAAESMLRTQHWLKTGCNAFNNKKPLSMPLSFWTDKDIWEYIKLKKLPYSKIYDMGYVRSGCIFCGYGCHLEKEPTRFQMLQRTHPKLWRYCMKPWDKGGLGMREVLEYYGVPYENYGI